MLDIRIYAAADEIEVDSDSQYAVFMTEEYLPQLEALQRRFAGVSMAGAVVPHLILGNSLVKQAISVLRFQRLETFSMLCDMRKAPEGLREQLAQYGSGMLLVFVDGLSAWMEPFVAQLNLQVPEEIVVMGGGTGFKDLQPRPTVFDGEGIYRDHALLIGTDLTLTAGVRHGWKSLYGPLVVTRAERNVLYELNGEPAFEVYRRALHSSKGVQIDAENFFEVAKSYPLGISSFSGNEFIIRDPIAANSDGSMTIVSSVRAFDSLYIMNGEEETLVEAACALSTEIFSRSESPVALIFDCISRVMFLEDDFDHEINSIRRCSGFDALRLYGMSSVGEISNQGFDEIRIFNKTLLIGSIHAK